MPLPLPDPEPINLALKGLCPRCKQGTIFQPGFLNSNLRDTCPSCGLDLTKSDNADGPAVFLIFILGFVLVPLALLLEVYIAPPMWVHLLLWGAIGLTLILASLRPLKAYILALQYKHLPWD